MCYWFLILISDNGSIYKEKGPARVNSDKRHGPKSSNGTQNEIATRDNLPQPNCDNDGKADNKRQAFINTDTRHFKIQKGDIGTPPLAGPLYNSPAILLLTLKSKMTTTSSFLHLHIIVHSKKTTL